MLKMYFMKGKKVYGSYREDACPFCGKQGTSKNKQGVPTCPQHKEQYLDLKCLCGEWLDILEGKYGPYGKCIKCGNINFKRALENNPKPTPKNAEPKQPDEIPKKVIKKQPTEIEITSDDPDYF